MTPLSTRDVKRGLNRLTVRLAQEQFPECRIHSSDDISLLDYSLLLEYMEEKAWISFGIDANGYKSFRFTEKGMDLIEQELKNHAV